MLIFILLLLTLAFGQDLNVLQQQGDVAEKCGEVAISEETAHFPMVLRLQLVEPTFFTNNCTSKAIVAIEKEEQEESLRPAWLSPRPVDLETVQTEQEVVEEKKIQLMEAFKCSPSCNYTIPTDVHYRFTFRNKSPSVEIQNFHCTSRHLRRKRFPSLIALGILGIGMGLVGASLGVYSAIEIVQLKEMHNTVAGRINALKDAVMADQDDLVKLESLTQSLYEYTHRKFTHLASELNKAACVEARNEKAIIQIVKAVKIRSNLYTDLSAVVSSVFSNRPSPITLPVVTIRSLIQARRLVREHSLLGTANARLSIRVGNTRYTLSEQKREVISFIWQRSCFRHEPSST